MARIQSGFDVEFDHHWSDFGFLCLQPLLQKNTESGRKIRKLLASACHRICCTCCAEIWIYLYSIIAQWLFEKLCTGDYSVHNGSGGLSLFYFHSVCFRNEEYQSF